MSKNQRAACLMAMCNLLDLALGTAGVVIDDKLSDMVFRAWGLLLNDGADAAIESLRRSARALPADVIIGG